MSSDSEITATEVDRSVGGRVVGLVEDFAGPMAGVSVQLFAVGSVVETATSPDGLFCLAFDNSDGTVSVVAEDAAGRRAASDLAVSSQGADLSVRLVLSEPDRVIAEVRSQLDAAQYRKSREREILELLRSKRPTDDSAAQAKLFATRLLSTRSHVTDPPSGSERFADFSERNAQTMRAVRARRASEGTHNTGGGDV